MIHIPKIFMGNLIEGSLERVLTNQSESETIEPQNTVLTTAENVSRYIYVPTENVYIAKERTLLGKNWYDSHRELHKQHVVMPTIPQFIAFINYLKNNTGGTNDASSQEVAEILDDILTVRDPWRAQWLDAKFTKQNNQLQINYNHQTISGQLKPQIIQPLTACIMEDCWADVINPNSQGLPTTKKEKNSGGIYFWYPREDRVAGFGVFSERAVLYCNWRPQYADGSLGVRASFQRS